MLSQEHFIGYVTTTLNNTFSTNNFETNGAPYAKSVAVTSYASVCLDGCKTDDNRKKDNRMITEFGQ